MIIHPRSFLAAAIWETLNGFYDTSPSGQAWLQAHIYPFWSDNLRLLALADEMVQGDDAGCNVYSGPLRDAALLAFLPVGVAFYFVTEKLTDLIESVLASIDLSVLAQTVEKQRAYRQPTRWLRFMLSFGLLATLVGWVVVVDKGALLEIDSNSRVAGLFVQPVHAVSAASALVAPSAPKPTPVSASLPTAMATLVSQPRDTPEPPTPSPPKEIKARVTADVLTVRSGPATGFAMIGKVRKGQELLLLGRTPQSDWLFASMGPQTGWVAAQYVSAVHSIADLPVRQP